MRMTFRAISCLSVLLLAACGGGGSATDAGGGGSDGGGSTGPASTAISDLIAFADAGTTRNVTWNGSSVANGTSGMTDPWRRTQNGSCASTCVIVDRLQGENSGLVQYYHDGQLDLIDLSGRELANTNIPDGSYRGPMYGRYRETSNGDWVATYGDMAIELHLDTGLVTTGGILDYTTQSGQSNSIQVFGEGTVTDGVITDVQTDVVVASGTAEERHLAGATEFVPTHTDTADAILGTIDATSGDGFAVETGFIASHCALDGCAN